VKKILIFGGTIDGRELAERLSADKDLKVTLSVATEFGKSLIDEGINTIVGRLEKNEIEHLISSFDVVVDATHPYAKIISKNILDVKKDKKVYRLIRDKSNLDGVIEAEDIKDACKKCSEGNILAATGSKEIGQYTNIERVYARVLPTKESILLCKMAGLKEENIIESFGKTTVEENLEVIRKYNIKNLITKDGGKRGGFEEKKKAAMIAGINFIVIKRPKEEGYHLEELILLLGGMK